MSGGTDPARCPAFSAPSGGARPVRRSPRTFTTANGVCT